MAPPAIHPTVKDIALQELLKVGDPILAGTLQALVEGQSPTLCNEGWLEDMLESERNCRGAPDIAVALSPNGMVAEPLRLTRMDWPLALRIVTHDARPGNAASVGMHLCGRIKQSPDTRASLWPWALEALDELQRSETELSEHDPTQAAHIYPTRNDAEALDADDLYAVFRSGRRPPGRMLPTCEQRDAAKKLERLAHRGEISERTLWFGADQPIMK